MPRLCSWPGPSIAVEIKGDGKIAALICSLASVHILTMTQPAPPRSTFQSPPRSVGRAAQFPSQPSTGSCGWGVWTQLSSTPGSGKTALSSSPARNPAKHNRAAAEALRNQMEKSPSWDYVGQGHQRSMLIYPC